MTVAGAIMGDDGMVTYIEEREEERRGGDD